MVSTFHRAIGAVRDWHTTQASISIAFVIAYFFKTSLYATSQPHKLLCHCWRHAPDEHPSCHLDTEKQAFYCFVCEKGGDVITVVREARRCSYAQAVQFLSEQSWQIPACPILPAARLTRQRQSSTLLSSGGRWVVHRYRDAEGVEQYQILRTPDKQFLLRHRGPDGEWVWNGKGVPRLLYKLYAIQGLKGVLIVEGEKDCDTLWAHELPAVTNPGGAGKWRDGYTEQLVAAGVRAAVILPDNDDVGRAHARAVRRSCRAAGIEVRIVDLPDLPPKGDVSDFLATHRKRDLLHAIGRQA